MADADRGARPRGSMTGNVSPAVHAGLITSSGAIGDGPGKLLDLATDWLRAEVASVRQPGRTVLVTIAIERARTYEAALAAATPEDEQLAWEQAIVRRSRTEVGSAAWADAHRISELLRFECVAAVEAAVNWTPSRQVATDVETPLPPPYPHVLPVSATADGTAPARGRASWRISRD